MRGHPEAADDDRQQADDEHGKMLLQLGPEKVAEMIHRGGEEKEPRPARKGGKADEKRKIITEQAADDGDELERYRGEAFDENECPAPFGVEFAQGVDARAIAVKLDDPMAERVEQQRADDITEYAAQH